MPPPAPTTEALPDALLGAILGLAGLSEGRSVILVSRRWNRLFYAEPSLWRSFQMAPGPFYPARWPADSGTAQLQARLSLLTHVCGLVEEMEVRDYGLTESGSWVLAGVSSASQPFLPLALSLLLPAKVTRLVFECSQQMPPQAAAALSRLIQLQGLEFRFLGAHTPLSLPPSLSATLARLSQLRTLACQASAVPSNGLVAAICQHLSQLTSLSLESNQPLPALQQLTLLTQLQILKLRDGSKGGVPRLFPVPSSFPNLNEIDFAADAMMQVAGARLSGCNMHIIDNGGVGITLKQATLPNIHALLTALLPPGSTSAVRNLTLQPSLQMDAVAFNPASWRSPLLAPLKTFSVWASQSEDIFDARGVLQEVLAQATQLSSLHILFWQLDVLPACIATHAGLHELMLLDCGLVDLPPGPYLSTLRTLNLMRNAFTRLPPVLAAATSLRDLDIMSFQGRPCDLEPADMDLLAGLPHLTKLELGLNKSRTPPSMQRWVRALRRRLPQLTVV